MFFQVIRLLWEVVFGEFPPRPVCSPALSGRNRRILNAAALLISRSAPGLELRRRPHKRRVLFPLALAQKVRLDTVFACCLPFGGGVGWINADAAHAKFDGKPRLELGYAYSG
jgi:hypothetical protein